MNLVEVLRALLLQVEQLPLAELPQQEEVPVLVPVLAVPALALELLLAVEVQAQALLAVLALEQVLEVALPPR